MTSRSTEILLDCQSGREAISAIYHHAQSSRHDVSLGNVVKKTDISSKGYMSGVLSGERTINPRYVPSFAKFVGLSSIETEVLELLCKIDRAHSKGTNLETVDNLSTELAALRKTLDRSSVQAGSEVLCDLDTLRVYAAFGIFAGSPRTEDLRGLFTTLPERDLKACLEKLRSLELICQEDDHWELSDRQVDLKTDSKTLTQYFKATLRDIEKHVFRWVDRPEEALLSSTIISVDKERYEKELSSFRAEFEKFRSRIECLEGNQIVHVNAFCYPHNSP